MLLCPIDSIMITKLDGVIKVGTEIYIRTIRHTSKVYRCWRMCR